MELKIADIAQKAGVSRATVSRVLNGSAAVNPRTMARVRQVIEQLGYVRPSVRPGPKPRQPHSSGLRTRTIALVILGPTRALLEESTMAYVIEGIQSACRARGLNLLLDQMTSADQIPLCVQNRQVDGVLMMATAGQLVRYRDCIASLSAMIPSIHLFSPGHSVASVDHVTVDDVAIGSLAFRTLREAGCRSFAVVDASSVFHEALLVRGRAFKDLAAVNAVPAHYFARHRSDCDIVNCLPQPLTVFDDFAQVAEGIKRHLSFPAGIFLTLERHAPELYDALAAAGLFARNQVTVIIAGATPRYVDHLKPAPIVIDPAFEQMINIAMDRLIDRILRQSGQPLSLLVSPRLASRKETPKKSAS